MVYQWGMCSFSRRTWRWRVWYRPYAIDANGASRRTMTRGEQADVFTTSHLVHIALVHGQHATFPREPAPHEHQLEDATQDVDARLHQ